MMPAWVQIVVGLAALVTATGVLWKKVLNPLRKAGNTAEEMYPLMVRLTEVFADNPDALKVLYEIAAQFKTNSGSSLRDVVNDLAKAIATLEKHAEIARILAERDREQLQRLLTLLDRLDAKVSGGRNALDRIELDRERVAKNLAISENRIKDIATALEISEDKVARVARHLLDAQDRADAVVGSPGEAADAFSQSPKGKTE